MLNEFWNGASKFYKALVFGAMGFIAAGLVISILGNATQNQGLAFASLPVIGIGLVLHAVGVAVRGHQVRKMIR
ncbi:DUF3188 domain-containing protein [Arthrobacter sp. KFRI-F3372]|uniref:DUF3188 domain-containing protein n=1 Tax=Pseudarthrobacter TaxID=1742993 RepID=UPI00203D7336|nr:DUF3188 domain-containing protein [Pseudarthrobacter sp. NCCP-2145]WHP59522.1 DUF3188 domain-containing protein [Arthrobacter sp. KFRI-F3372]GKV71877.1 hypothetical protein NCCP2145_12580 [Pseudarthrobacter sp. NCCP-2145]